MSFIILLGICAAYLAFAVLIAAGFFKFTHRVWLAFLAFLIVLVLPVHEGAFGYPEFREFDAQHQGTAFPQDPIFVEGFLVEGRIVTSPAEALRVDAYLGNFQYKEFKREMVSSLKPAPAVPLAAYVQFFLTTIDDPSCIQELDLDPSHTKCVGVTSSAEPRSEFARLEEPDQREVLGEMQLNDSKLFPIFGTHTRIRKVKSNTVVAEVWQFRLPSKMFSFFAWFSKRNPPSQVGRIGLTPFPMSKSMQ